MKNKRQGTPKVIYFHNDDLYYVKEAADIWELDFTKALRRIICEHEQWLFLHPAPDKETADG